MLTDSIELLERQVASLLRQQGPDFFMHLPMFVDAMRSHPRLEGIVEDLHREMVSHLESINKRRSQVRGALLGIRQKLVLTFPELDEGELPRAMPGDAAWREYQGSFAQFEAMSADPSTRWPNARRVDTDPDGLEVMAKLLDSKLEKIDPKCCDERVTPIRLEVGNAHEQLWHVQREYDLATMTSGAVATLRFLHDLGIWLCFRALTNAPGATSPFGSQTIA